jgi:drug/metabolite transporter (DMT)-like permease
LGLGQSLARIRRYVLIKPEAASAATSRERWVEGALMMVAATFCFTALDSILKSLAVRHDVLFLSWGRNLMQVIFLGALIPFLGTVRVLHTRHPWVQMGRGALLVASTALVVLSLQSLPMAQTYAVTLSSPVIAVVLAAVFLGEKISVFRGGWILAGFAGALVALRPGTPEAGVHLLLPLGMALANAIYHVLTRSIAAHEDPVAMNFLAALAGMALTTLALPWSWSYLTMQEWGLLAIGGFFGTLAQLLLVQAYCLAPMAVVSPMVYTQIISACLFGYFIFGEIPTIYTLTGGGLVSLAGIVLVMTRR